MPARVVAIEAAFEIASHRGQPSLTVRPHPDRIELERRHPEVVVELPKLGQLLNERRDQLLGRVQFGQRVGHHERFQAGERIERDLRDLGLFELFDVDAAAVGQCHRRCAKASRVGDGEIDLVLRRYPGFEGDAIGLGHGAADPVLDEVQALLFPERGRQIRCPAHQPRLAFFADPSFEDRLDEHRATALDQRPNLLLARARFEHLGGRKADEAQQLRTVEHAGDLHRVGLRRRSVYANRVMAIKASVTVIAPPIRVAICAKGISTIRLAAVRIATSPVPP